MNILLYITLLFSFPKEVAIHDKELNEKLVTISKEILPDKVENLTLKRRIPPADMAESGRDSSIYFVFDRKKPIAVIKACPHGGSVANTPELDAEYLSLETLSRLKFKDFTPVKMYGSFEDSDGIPMGYIVESVAPGKSLNSYLKLIGPEKDLEKREALLGELRVGMVKVASGIAELHSKKHFKGANPFYTKKFSKVPPGPYGYIHGDLHVGNVFYDTKEQQATFIDFSHMYPSLSGGPVGIDIAHFLITVEMLGSYFGLSQEELTSLTETFLSTYHEKGPSLSDSTIAFYKNYYLNLYARDFEDFEESQLGQAKHVYTYCKNELEKNSMS